MTTPTKKNRTALRFALAGACCIITWGVLLDLELHSTAIAFYGLGVLSFLIALGALEEQ